MTSGTAARAGRPATGAAPHSAVGLACSGSCAQAYRGGLRPAAAAQTPTLGGRSGGCPETQQHEAWRTGQAWATAARLNQRGRAWWAGRPFWATVQRSAPWRGPAGRFVRTARGVRWGSQVAQVHREGAFVVGARESWTVVASRSRSSIERGIGCFCWCPAAVSGSSFFLPGLLSEETARRGAAVPGEPRCGQPAQVIDGCWKAVL
jgi:hypothetical protein